MNIENGNKVWRNSSGRRHRTDGPAVELANGGQEWYLNDQRHRIGGPAIDWNNGYSSWWLDGILHRIDGPAVKYDNGTKKWYVHGRCHRVDGPALMTAEGNREWWIRGMKYPKPSFVRYIKQHQINLLMLTRSVNPCCGALVNSY